MGEVERLIASDPDWLTRLTEDYSIIVNRDENLVSLKYNQIESPMHEAIVQECRGMVVCTERRSVLAHPYNKFWNYGDVPAATIDWSTARVLEKLDGSLMTLYWDALEGVEGEWMVASSGTPRASGSFGESEEVFREAFWRTWDALGMEVPRGSTSWCYMFEFCDAPNRIVVKHDKPRIVLHGARNLATGIEASLDELEWFAEDANWEVVKSYPISSIEECLAKANELDPIACEGFIVVDAQFNRIKIKSPRYVILHHMKGEATLRRSIELWQTGEIGELLLHFPEFAPKILPVHERLEALAVRASQAVIENAHLARKDFAEIVKPLPFSSIAFRLYGQTATEDAARAVMRAASMQSLERMLEAAQ